MQCRKVYIRYISRFFFILICFFSLLLVPVFVFSSRASDFSSLCVVYKMFWNKSACGKCSAPSFLRLSAAFYVFYIVYSFCVLFFSACRIQLLTSRRRHEVALPFACQFAVYWTLRMYTFYPVMWMMCVRALTHSPLVYTRILLLFTHKIDFSLQSSVVSSLWIQKILQLRTYFLCFVCIFYSVFIFYFLFWISGVHMSV